MMYIVNMNEIYVLIGGIGMKKAVKIFSCLLAILLILGSVFSVSAASVGEAVLNRTQIITVTPDEGAGLWFTAPESGFYKFYSMGDYDVFGYVIDTNDIILAYGDDCDTDLNFSIHCYMEKGHRYMLAVDSYEDSSVWFGIKIENSDIKSVQIDDVTLYEGVDNTIMYDYDYETDELIEYMCYLYNPSFKVVLKNDTILNSDETGGIEFEGQTYYCECTDDQSAQNEWGIGTYTVTANVFGFLKNITVIVKENIVESVEINDVTVYEDWDCITIDETWEEILGIEIPFPIKIYYYMPSYTVNLKDGTQLTSNEKGEIEYDGRVHALDIDGDTQDLDNLWQSGGVYQSSATILGHSDTFMVSVKPNPAQSIHFDDIVLKKDWDYYVDYEYNPDTEEYDLEWKHYDYVPSYQITLKDGTVLESDDEGGIEYDGKQYIFIGFNDGQSYYTQWTEGTYTVSSKVFGIEISFKVTLEEWESKLGDTNNDGKINNKDLGLLMQQLNGWSVKIVMSACDVTADGNVNNKDYGVLMQYLNGWDVEIL